MTFTSWLSVSKIVVKDRANCSMNSSEDQSTPEMPPPNKREQTRERISGSSSGQRDICGLATPLKFVASPSRTVSCSLAGSPFSCFSRYPSITSLAFVASKVYSALISFANSLKGIWLLMGLLSVLLFDFVGAQDYCLGEKLIPRRLIRRLLGTLFGKIPWRKHHCLR